MGTAGFAATLNRRHKTALCAALICVGLIVLLGGGVRAAAGIGLLGIAFSWAFGSNYRAVHWSFVAFGLLLLIPPVAAVFLWPRNKPEAIKFQTSIVKGDRLVVDAERSIMVDEEDRQERQKDREELSKSSDQLLEDEQELRTLQAEDSFRYVLKNDWELVAGGILLLSSGLGLTVGVKPVRQSQAESSPKYLQ